MRELKEGFHLVGRFPGPMLAYLGALIFVEAFLLGSAKLIARPAVAAFLHGELSLTLTACQLVAIAVAAAAQVIAFSEFAARIDRPLWKVRGWKDPLRRFFSLWFLLQLGAILMFKALDKIAAVSANEDLNLALFLQALLYVALIVPLGVCLMFAGRPFAWKSLVPLVNRPGAAAAIIVFSFFVTAWLQISLLSQGKDAPFYVTPLIDLLSACFDFIIFAAMWALCMFDRQHGPPDYDA